MGRDFRLAILSDIHYACAAEQAAGDDYEIRAIPNPLLRLLLRTYRHYVWLRYPLQQNGQLDRFLAEVGVRQPSPLPHKPASETLAGTAASKDAGATTAVDYAIANGDYSCNVAALGVSDEAAMQSARECLGKLRGKFGEKLLANLGDHELGKLRGFLSPSPPSTPLTQRALREGVGLEGGEGNRTLATRGGLRLESWRRATTELGLRPFWQLRLGNYVLIGVVSTLVALPVFAHDMLLEERPAWEKLRDQHFAEIRAAFAALAPQQRVLLFCHDPTALPFLGRDETVRGRLPQIEQTLIGHLHSNLYLRMSRLLAGMPPVSFLGSSIRKLSTAVNQARRWRPFRVRLCPSLAGIELLRDGGYYTAQLDAEAQRPIQFQFHPLPR